MCTMRCGLLSSGLCGVQVIEGMGELHLDIIVDRLRREFNVECSVGAPQVRRSPCWPRGLTRADDHMHA